MGDYVEKDLISVIVPIYKVEIYLENCIKSIVNQTYENLQIILVEDGSPDRCGNICDKYEQLDSRIIVIHKENGGVSDARNTGLDASTGKYIIFIDSDDYIHPQMIQVLMSNLKQYDTDISICSYKLVKDMNSINNEYSNHTVIYNNVEALSNMYNDLYITTVVAWNKVYKRSLFEGIQFPKGKVHEDEFTIYKLLYKANKIVYTDAVLYYYLQRNTSIMGQKLISNDFDAIQAQEEVFNFMYAKEESELINKALNRYLSYMIDLYFRIIKNPVLGRELAKKVKSQYYTCYQEYIGITNFSFIKRFKFKSFMINDMLCKLIIIIMRLRHFMKGVCFERK